MKISYDWIKEYVDIRMAPETLEEALTMSGTEVISSEKLGDDRIMELEVTPNRPDCLSMVGMAREISAVTGKRFKKPTAKLPSFKVLKDQTPLKIEIKDKDLCPRYTGRIIKGVEVKPSPVWLKKRIESMGLRPVNNIVDITNFCLFESGQPLHAFDYAKLDGGRIIVRRARKGEKITTIDNNVQELAASDLVIADSARPVAIAGVMGGVDTEVAAFTKTILLESAYFAPNSVRRTARRLGLPSESSYRFERSVDLGAVLSASDRAAALILDLAGGELGQLCDIGKKAASEKKISFDMSSVNRVLGTDLSEQQIKKILTLLQFKLKPKGKDKVDIQIPSFRQDLNRGIDLIEEIARVYGYERITPKIPHIVGHTDRVEDSRKVILRSREILASAGLDEVITYSLLSRAKHRNLRLSEDNLVALRNPLSLEQEVMQTSQLPGMLDVVAHNLNRKVDDIEIFAFGRSYQRMGKKRYKEEAILTIAMCGNIKEEQRGYRKVNFFDLKGALDLLMDELRVPFSIEEKRFAWCREGLSCVIKISEKEAGFMGELKGDIRGQLGIERPVFIAEVNFDAVTKSAELKRSYKEVPKFPSILRDISIVIDESISADRISKTIREAAGSLAARVELVDIYHGKQIPNGSKGMTYRVEYLDKKKTLRDEEVNGPHQKVCSAITEQLNAKIR
ncbi:MAG: phenylalanine--tRNA ligase subunit beta [Candidatus Omnitrophica bacterium]|nr:phenylalanine--tRNA ligase subunit beta [Candidatus Omnitrophota bacterium]